MSDESLKVYVVQLLFAGMEKTIGIYQTMEAAQKRRDEEQQEHPDWTVVAFEYTLLK